MKSSSCRQRKLVCGACGYTVRATRSWMQQGLPTCSCGAGELRPDSLADLAFLGEISIEDVGQAAWNAICRENGWEIVRNAGQSKRVGYQSHLASRTAPAEQCAYPGCGRWVPNGQDRCSQHSTTPAMAF